MEWLDKIKDFSESDTAGTPLRLSGRGGPASDMACRCHLWLEVDVFPSG